MSSLVWQYSHRVVLDVAKVEGCREFTSESHQSVSDLHRGLIFVFFHLLEESEITSEKLICCHANRS